MTFDEWWCEQSTEVQSNMSGYFSYCHGIWNAALENVEPQPASTNKQSDAIPDSFSLQCDNCGEHFSEVYHAIDHSEDCQ